MNDAMESKRQTRKPRKPVRRVQRKPQHPAKTWQDVFLDELRQCGNVRAACAQSGIERSTAYKSRKDDDAFAAAWKDALDDAIDSLEAEAWRRARDGNEKIILWQGKPVKVGRKFLIERDYSDTLLTLLLKAHRGEKFRERTDTLNFNFDLSQLSDEQLERISNGEDPRIVIATPGAGGVGETPPETESAAGTESERAADSLAAASTE